MRKLKKSKMHRELTKNSLKIQHTILETIQNTRNMKKKKRICCQTCKIRSTFLVKSTSVG